MYRLIFILEKSKYQVDKKGSVKKKICSVGEKIV